MLYGRSELKLLLALAGAVVVGLAVREWRAGFPELAERLERFDTEAAVASAPAQRGATPPPGAGRARPSGETPCAGAAAWGSRPDRLAAPEESDPRPLDLNRASADQLARLPGVGPALGRRIVEERERGGPFTSPDSLRRVFGLGPRKLGIIRPLVTAAGADGTAAGGKRLPDAAQHDDGAGDAPPARPAPALPPASHPATPPTAPSAGVPAPDADEPSRPGAPADAEDP